MDLSVINNPSALLPYESEDSNDVPSVEDVNYIWPLLNGDTLVDVNQKCSSVSQKCPSDDVSQKCPSEWLPCEFEDIRQKCSNFAKERDWCKFHNPRNLMLALVGEIGELAELFQWHDDALGPFDIRNFRESKMQSVRDELADCAIYLIRLADRCNVDLGSAIRDKMVHNAVKYPIQLVKGKSYKYNEYSQTQDQ